MTVHLDCEKNFISKNGGPTRPEDWFLFGVGEKWPTHCQTRSFLASVPGSLLKIFIWRESLGSVQGLFTAKPGQWVCSMLLGQCAIPVWVCSHWFTHSSVVLNFMYVCTWKPNWVICNDCMYINRSDFHCAALMLAVLIYSQCYSPKQTFMD